MILLERIYDFLNEAEEEFNYFYEIIKALSLGLKDSNILQDKINDFNFFQHTINDKVKIIYDNSPDKFLIQILSSKGDYYLQFGLYKSTNQAEFDARGNKPTINVYVDFYELKNLFYFIEIMDEDFKSLKNNFIHEYRHYYQYKQGQRHLKDKKRKNRYTSSAVNKSKYYNHYSEVDAYFTNYMNEFMENKFKRFKYKTKKEFIEAFIQYKIYFSKLTPKNQKKYIRNASKYYDEYIKNK
jgi:hypothetical protein